MLSNFPSTFLIIDGHALIYRSFHAFPKTLINSQGQLTNAVYGFARILLSAIRDFEPEYLVVTFDHKEKTFRHKQFDGYKAHRPPMPDQLISQIQLVKDFVSAMNIPQFEMGGFEADDLIGTLCAHNEREHTEIKNLVVSGDKDLFQLVTEQTHVFIPGRGRFSKDKEYDAESVLKKMKVRVDQIVDLKALMGDPSDNIPGVRGVGPKTAVNLLTEFETLEKVYAEVDRLVESGEKSDLIKGALFKKLVDNKEMAFLSQSLARIETNVPLECELDACRVREYDKEQVVTLFEDLNFKSLIKALPQDKFESSVQEALF